MQLSKFTVLIFPATGYGNGLRRRLTAKVELLQTRFSQVNLWLLSSGVLLARKALWITRLGVLVKENALVT